MTPEIFSGDAGGYEPSCSFLLGSNMQLADWPAEMYGRWNFFPGKLAKHNFT